MSILYMNDWNKIIIRRVPQSLIDKALENIQKEKRAPAMDTKEFKKLFGEIAKRNGFNKGPGGWYLNGKMMLTTLSLQRSDYSVLYYLNIKSYINSKSQFKPSKFLIVNDLGHIFTRQPKEYDGIFDLESELTVTERRTELEKLFKSYILSHVNKLETLDGIKEWVKDNKDLLTKDAREKIREIGIEIQEH